MSSLGRTKGARTARVTLAGLLAIGLVAIVVGLTHPELSAAGSSTSSGDGSSTQPLGGAANVTDGPTAGLPASGDQIAYGLAEPAGSLPGTYTPSDLAAWDQIRADVVASGACWLRSDVNEWLTRAIDAFSWLGTSQACTASGASPIKILGILDQQTVWSAWKLCPSVQFSDIYERRHVRFTLDDWDRLVTCVADRYAGRISAFEIWNEPLLDNSMMGYEDGSASHYADLLRVAYADIKAADPTAVVVALGGSDLYAGGDQGRLDEMRAFTTSLIDLGARRWADAVSVHAYPWGRDDQRVWSSYVDELRFQADAWQLPVWVTETGSRATDGVSQSAYAEAAYALFAGAGVRHIFWFSITDQGDGAFGLRGRPVEATLRGLALADP